MSSYNENLHSTVVVSLQQLEQDRKSNKSQLETSAVTLYYAEGAIITADEKLKSDADKAVKQQATVIEAVRNSNISANVLMSATQQKAYAAQSVTNMAVGASNTQIAAKAIVRLAADIGSVYAILSAADYDSEIYKQSEEVNEFMQNTAYAAEVASQRAMEASTSMAEVSSSAIADIAKITNDSITNLLQVTEVDFTTAITTFVTQTETVVAANTVEKLAEGALEDINVEYRATQNAYRLNNKSLNLNLHVYSKANNMYTVLFDNYTNPFVPLERLVDSYNIILVKDSVKSIFSISNAEALVSGKKEDTEGIKDKQPQQYKSIKVPSNGVPISSPILIGDLVDSDGDPMQLGVKYVVFVLVILQQPYKKKIGNFDDYLSAPSATFTLTNKFQIPLPEDITTDTLPDGETTVGQSIKFSVPKPLTQSLVPVDPTQVVEYRCIFLQDVTNSIKGLLTTDSLLSVENEVEILEQIAEEYDPGIAYLKSQLVTLGVEPDEEQVQQQNAEHAAIPQNETAELRQQLFFLEGERTQALSKLVPARKDAKPGFFFNLKLAEQINIANYIKAVFDSETGKGTVTIINDATDNFGNLLIDKNYYIAAILAVPSSEKVPEENRVEYTNVLSDFANTAPFIYHSPQQ